MRAKAVLLIGLAGLLLGAVIHILTVLAAPRLSQADAWTKAALSLPYFVAVPTHPQMARPQQTAEKAADGATPRNIALLRLDPQFNHALCRFHLRSGPVHILLGKQVDFWTLNLFHFGGVSFFSLNTHIYGGGPPSLLVATPRQLAQLRLTNAESLQESLVVETGHEEGALLLRAYQRYGRALPSPEEEMANTLSCAPT